MSKKTKSTTRNAGNLRPVVRGIIPSQSAMRYTSYVLREAQFKAMQSCHVHDREGMKEQARQIFEQADDLGQVAQFLEERLIESANTPGQRSAAQGEDHAKS